MGIVLARNWWAFAIRGLLGILFGVIAITLPGAAMLSLVFLFAIYAFADGVFAILAAVRAASQHERWMLLVLEGIVNIAAGVIALSWPAITVYVFVILIGAWALISGGFMLAASFRLDAAHGRWWLALGGIASIAYGALLFIAPMIGAIVVTWWIGAYAIFFGVSMMALAFRLRGRLHAHGAA
jgi:uncharacterized membrane protein HdeD (DUF308 family)